MANQAVKTKKANKAVVEEEVLQPTVEEVKEEVPTDPEGSIFDDDLGDLPADLFSEEEDPENFGSIFDDPDETAEEANPEAAAQVKVETNVAEVVPTADIAWVKNKIITRAAEGTDKKYEIKKRVELAVQNKNTILCITYFNGKGHDRTKEAAPWTQVTRAEFEAAIASLPHCGIDESVREDYECKCNFYTRGGDHFGKIVWAVTPKAKKNQK